MKRTLLALLSVSLFFVSCGSGEQQTAEKVEDINLKKGEVNVYTHRHYDADKALFKQFEASTGIKVNVVSAKADELIKRMEIEGERSPSDVLITVDAGRLYRAKEKNLLQAVDLPNALVPAHLKDKENFWFGLTQRARVVVYSKDRVKPSDLSSYSDLSSDKWSGKLLVRSSSNLYNQSLMASVISHDGADKAKDWAEGLVRNMARSPKGNDRDQVKAIASGIGDIAIVNTYYIGKLLNSSNEEEKKAGEHVGVFFPNQESNGTHMNVSGAGVAKYAPNKDNAVKFIEFLLSKEAQKVFAEANYEYPVNPDVEASALLQSWGTFKADSIDLSILGELNKEAVLVFDKAGWK